MITLTYKQTADRNFHEAIQALAAERLPTKVAYSIKKIADDIMKSRKAIGEEFKTIMEAHAKRDEKGEIVFEDGGMALDESKKEDFQTLEKEFGNKEIKIDRAKLSLESLSNIEVTASQLSFLDPLITEMSVVSQVEEQVSSTG